MNYFPDDEGFVRVCSDPATYRPQSKVPFESRYLYVPAAIPSASTASFNNSSLPNAVIDAPLVVPLDKQFAPSGHGAVSSRNTEHMGYNGFAFRKMKAHPELQIPDDPLTREAWPVGLLHTSVGSVDGEEPVNGSESKKCAPENWVIRRPVARFASKENGIVARYPPRNKFNSKYQYGTRYEGQWVLTAIYREPPFPTDFQSQDAQSSAFAALSELKSELVHLGKTPTVLDGLRGVYRRMGNRQGVGDPWLQRRVTSPSPAAVAKYRDAVDLFKRREGASFGFDDSSSGV